MQISDFLVDKYKSSIFLFKVSQKKSLGLILFSRDGRVTTNIQFFGLISLQNLFLLILLPRLSLKIKLGKFHIDRKYFSK